MNPAARDRKRARDRARYMANHEEQLRKRSEWRANNPDKKAAENRAYKLTHPETVREGNAAYFAANRERENQRRRDHYQANRESELATRRGYYAANRPAFYANVRRREALKRGATVDGAEVTSELLAARMAYWGNRCWMCGGPFEHVDHVKPLSKGGLHVLANLRPSCASCNLRKSDRWDGSAAAMIRRVA